LEGKTSDATTGTRNLAPIARHNAQNNLPASALEQRLRLPNTLHPQPQRKPLTAYPLGTLLAESAAPLAPLRIALSPLDDSNANGTNSN